MRTFFAVCWLVASGFAFSARALQLNPVTPADKGLFAMTPLPTPSLEPTVAPAPPMSGPVTVEGYFWLRGEDQTYSSGLAAGSTAASPKWLPPSGPDGAAGFYVKKAEIRFSGKLLDWGKWVAAFDFPSLKFKDLGLEVDGGIGDWKGSLRAGQFRQAFGIEQQTSSAKIDFNERAVAYGGMAPFGTAVPVLVTERVMGLHFYHRKDLGLLAYEIGLSLANDATEDQAAGASSLGVAFPKQARDQDISEIGRLGIEPAVLNAMLPWGGKLRLGASAAHDSQNSAYDASSPTTQAWADVVGLDARFDMFNSALRLQAEWISRNQFGPTATAAYSGLRARSESWYGYAVAEPLDFFMAKAPRIQVMARFEGDAPNVDLPGAQSGRFPTTYNAATLGLKWLYGLNSCTAVNYTVYGLDWDFGSMAGTQLLTIQQQVAF